MATNDTLLPAPQGTVTFLFTDIEGSTQLLRQHGEAYPDALHWHRVVLREAAAAHHGYEVDTQGDAMFFAFPRARDATAAAAASQIRFANETHGGVAFKVRMGLHTGEPVFSGGFYVGLDVHRGARISSTAHGGQTVLSSTTRELVWSQLPHGLTLNDLGEHQLKDFAAPVRIYQLEAEGLNNRFRPLRSKNPPRHNIQQPTRAIVGRDKDLAAAHALLKEPYTRLLTFVGPSGAGKTRLAQELAVEIAKELETFPEKTPFPDGLFWLALSQLNTRDEAIAAIYAAMDLTPPTTEMLKALSRDLSGLKALLVLDNCEQLADICSLVQELTENAPSLKILATSRVALHLSREREMPLAPLSFPSLPLPPLDSAAFDPDHWRNYSALEFFERCARDSKTSWQLSPQTLHATAQICALLDGLPLAIELAASRLKMLPLQGLLQRLQSSFSLEVLTGGAYDRTQRQQTMRGAIIWSYDLLSERQRLLLSTLSLFHSGASLEAIESIFKAVDAEFPNPQFTDIFDELCILVEQSLLLREESPDNDIESEPRFRLLHMVQRFAAEHLDDWAEAATIRRSFALFFARQVNQWDMEPIQTGNSTSTNAITREYPNITAALEWWIGEGSDEALRMAVHLWPYWESHGLSVSGRNFLERAIEVNSTRRLKSIQPLETEILAPQDSLDTNTDHSFDAIYTGAMNAAGALALNQGDFSAARQWFQSALDLRREHGNPLEVAASINNLSVAARRAGDYESSRAGLEESLRLYQNNDQEQMSARVQNNLGNLLREIGEDEKAEILFNSSLKVFQGLNDEIGVAASLNNLGISARERGDLGVARGLLEGALELQRRHCQITGCAHTLHELGLLAIELGETTEAHLLLGEALWTWRESDDKASQILGVEGFAHLFLATGDVTTALRLAAVADIARQTLDTPRSPIELKCWNEFEAQCHENLPSETITKARTSGQIWGLKNAVAQLLGGGL